MFKANERLSMILAMKKYGLDLTLLKEFESGQLLELCGSLEKHQTPLSWYTNQLIIQKELLQHEQFFFLFV